MRTSLPSPSRGGFPRGRLAAAVAVGLAAVAAISPRTYERLVVVSGDASGGLGAGLVRHVTREETVSIRIDAERRLVIDPPAGPTGPVPGLAVGAPDAAAGARDGASAGSAASGPPAGDWLVLDHRWMDGADGTASPARSMASGSPDRPNGVAGTEAGSPDDSMSYVGAVMSEDGHVAITPPFIVLTRGDESVLLRLDEVGREAAVSVDEPMPDWVSSDPDRGIVVARFDGLAGIEIGADTVRLQRRFFGW